MEALKKYTKMGFEFTWYVLPSGARWLWDILISRLWSFIKPLLKRLPLIKIGAWLSVVIVVYCVACGFVIFVGCIWKIFN